MHYLHPVSPKRNSSRKPGTHARVIVAAGPDAGNIGTLHGPSLHREFELMGEADVTPMQIIVDATRNAASVFSPIRRSAASNAANFPRRA
jgi:hypothetical protein